MGNTALSSYIVDSYYEHSMDVITFYTVIINVSSSSTVLELQTDFLPQLSAFAEPWFINTWVEASGMLHFLFPFCWYIGLTL